MFSFSPSKHSSYTYPFPPFYLTHYYLLQSSDNIYRLAKRLNFEPLAFGMAIQVEFLQTSQDLTALHACAASASASAFPPSQIQPQHYFNHTNLLVSSSTSITPSLPSLEKHDYEVDHHIKLQGEKLRMKLQEQGKQQLETVLNTVEINMLNSMRQKDEEIALAVRKRMELEDLLNRVEAENRAWRRAALESEAMMLSLSNSLEMMKEKAHCSTNNVWADEAQSCWDENARGDDDDEQIERGMAA